MFLGFWFVDFAAGPDAPGAKAASEPTSAATSQVATSGPEIPDLGAGSPKALLESMAKVLSEDSKPNAWLVFQPPANRDLAKTELELASKLGAKAAAVTDLVEAKIGKVQAGMVRSMQGGVTAGGELTLRNQITQITTGGKIDWDKVKITEKGDKAQAEIADNAGTIFLTKAGGKWYLGEGEGQETLAKDVEGSKEMTASLMKVLDQVQQKVNSGEMTRKNFIQEYQDIINSNMNPGKK